MISSWLWYQCAFLLEALSISGVNLLGGIHILRCMGMCHPSGLLFHQKSLNMSPILIKKILTRGSHFTKIAKIYKIGPFWGRKILRNGPRFVQSFNNRLAVSWGKKSLDIGRGCRPGAAHPSKNNLAIH